MQESLRKEIERKSRKLLKRSEYKLRQNNFYRDQYIKRIGRKKDASPQPQPPIMNIDRHFDPIYCIKNSNYLSKRIWKKLISHDYKPKPALLYKVKKPGGGFRNIMEFSIPDSAVANMFYHKLTRRNLNNLSPHNFSYRPDRNIFDAIIAMSSSLNEENVFVVQYDFEKYFDSIPHNYILELISRDNFFLVSDVERSMIKSFLSYEYADYSQYHLGNFKCNNVGVPQGSTISLFLSNIANHELDKDLERHDGQFVRYADDVVAITYSYESALGVRSIFARHQERSGLQINEGKSVGIRILDKYKNREISSINNFDYLGHKFTKEDVLLSDRAVRNIKHKCSHLIYLHLIDIPKNRNKFSKHRVGPPFVDWDLVTCINALRRYLYGGLSGGDLDQFIHYNQRMKRIRGLMSFYPLITNCDQLVKLDGWLVNIISRAYRERRKILLSKYNYADIKISNKELIDGTWHYSSDPNIQNETKLPSFVYAWRATRKHYIQFGLGDVEVPRYYYEDNFY